MTLSCVAVFLSESNLILEIKGAILVLKYFTIIVCS